LLIAAWTLLSAEAMSQAQNVKQKEVSQAIQDYFKKSPPELKRYAGLTLYGETLSSGTVSKDAVAREADLLEEAAAAGMLKSPPDEVLSLGHNLIVHDPIKGEAYLRAVNESADLSDDRVGAALCVATLAAGEPGEKMAVAELASPIKSRRVFWARYLEHAAIYSSSVKPILNRIGDESEPAIKVSLIRALAMIGSPDSLAGIQAIVERATTDDVQGAAIYAYVELAGFDGIAYVENVKPVGAQSTRERDEGLAWLKKETRPDSKHAREVVNDVDFVKRFGDLDTSPAIRWLAQEGLLQEAALKEPPKLGAAKKKELLGLLVESRGFGLEAAKGTLFRSLSREDEASLLQIRAVGFYSPNDLSSGRMKTIGIMVRQIRQEP
jgi:hypothetical protein